MPMKDGDNMVLISVHVPKRVLNTIDDLVKEGIFPNRSEAIRMALLLLLEWKLFSRGPEVLPKKEEDPTDKAFRAFLVQGR